MINKKIKGLLNANLEFVLLVGVWLFLFTWFSHTFKSPVEQPNTTFQYTYWLGEDVQSPKRLWAKDILCKQPSSDLSPDAVSWCKDSYPDKSALAWLKSHVSPLAGIISRFNSAPTINESALHTDEEQQYQYVQKKFLDIFEYRGSATPTTAIDETPDQIPSEMVEELQTKYAINEQHGSLALKCSWWLLNALEKQTPTAQTPQFKNDLALARADLLNHPKNKEFFTSSSLWSSDWQPLATQDHGDLAKSCAQKVGTVPDSYEKAANANNMLYSHGANYTRTIQTLHLSHSMHIIFILYTAIAYGILVIMRQRISVAIKIVAFYAGWVAAYYFSTKILSYPAIEDFGFLLSIITIIIFVLLLATPKNNFVMRFQSASPFIYPLFVFFTGFSLLFMLDWSLLSNYDKFRFLALRQIGYLFLALMLISIAPLIRQGVFEFILIPVNLINRIPMYFSKKNKDTVSHLKKGDIAKKAFLLVAVFILTGVLFLNKDNVANLTSETTRLFCILIFSAFLSVLSKESQQKSLAIYLIIFLVVFGVAIYLGTAVFDFGPLMIITYSIIVLFMAKAAVTLSSSSFAKSAAHRLGFILLGLAGTLFLLNVAYHSFISISSLGTERTKERVVSMQVPFQSTSDQLALTRYFTASAPDEGYGLGGVPWKGDKRSMPEQTQSDYMPVALYGVLGKSKFTLLSILYLSWLAIIVLAYQRLTLGFNRRLSSIEMSTSFFGWVAIIWTTTIMMQVCVTFMGNLGIAPLTGVSWPFLSYGQVSLVINCVVLGLLLHVPVEETLPQ